MPASIARPHRPTGWLVLAVAGVLAQPLMPPFAARLRADEESGTQWAVLIGVQAHEDRALNLRYTQNDVKALRHVLEERAGVTSDHILQMTDDPRDRPPTRENLELRLPAFLNRIKAEDRVIVFFSGHGCRHKEKTYLVPRDFKRTDPEASGLPVSRLRDWLNGCQARAKFLILDCCHAGDDKSVEQMPGDEGIDESLVKSLARSVRGCVVLASCDDNESSLEWAEHQQGVFTYWLCCGLDGAAADGMGTVTAAGLEKYLDERVPYSARQIAPGRTQTPVHFGKVEGDPALLTLRPEKPESLCRHLADHIDLEMRRRKLRRVGVLEMVQPEGNRLALAGANLPAYCAERIRLELSELASGSYTVAEASVMHKAARDVTLETRGNPKVLHRLVRDAGELEALVTGIVRRSDENLVVQCEMIRTKDGRPLVSPSGVFALSEGVMADWKPWSWYPRLRPQGSPTSPAVLQYIEEQSQDAHPLQNDGFPFPIELWTVKAGPDEDVTERTHREPKVFSSRVVKDTQTGKPRTELMVGARNNETFEIHVANNSPQRVAMVLLVDGINTLGMKRERLETGRPWILDKGQQYVIPGWTRLGAAEGGKDATNRFLFVDLAESVAGRQKFGDALGLITIGFYGEVGRASGVPSRIAVGARKKTEVHELKRIPFRVGPQLAVVQIRYVKESELDR